VPAPNEAHDQFTAGATFYGPDGAPLPPSQIPMALVLRTGMPVRDCELVVERPDGARHVVTVNIDPLVDGHGNRLGAINFFQDITERKQIHDALAQSRSDLREQEQRLAATYEHAAIGIAEVDAQGRLLRVNEAVCAITGRPRETLVGSMLYEKTLPPDAEPDREAFCKQVRGELGIYSIEKRLLRADGRVIWISVRSTPVRDAHGRFLFGVRVVQDITERKAAEERQKLLVARSATSAGTFRERFEGRLIALSKAHDQLTVRNWQDAVLRDILNAAIAPYLTGGKDQAVLRGEDIMLRPRAALTLAMVFHELTTNAAKYGALSVAAGKIGVTWAVRSSESRKPLLSIEWREEGGPTVVKPARRSFGSRFIEGSIASELQGKARILYEPSGVRCTIDLPLASAQQSAPHSSAAQASLSWEDRAGVPRG
jgi:PAS domain S-box-containing protein